MTDALEWFKNKKHGIDKFYTFLIFNFIVVTLFFLINLLLPFDSFGRNVQSNDEDNKAVSMFYYTVTIHSTVAPGDIYPKTAWARVFFCLQVALSFIGNIYIVFIR